MYKKDVCMKISTNYQVNSFNQKNQTNKPSFKRNWAEHASWGARYIKETNKANFKLFSFPDAKMVFVEVAKKASEKMGSIKERIVQLMAVQGATLAVTGVAAKDEDTTVYQMNNNGNGVFEVKDVPVEAGAQYRYVVVTNDSKVNLVKDPYSMKQPDINGWSEIYDPDNYEWKATDWLEGKDSRRIMRNPQDPKRGLGSLIIEEVNIPTLSEEGTFDKAKAYIDKIAEKGLATAVEFMPVENTYSLQWGYDGVDKFAVNEKMGSAAQFKELIDYAHEKGLNVIIDMVPNHIGPDGNYLTETGPYKGKVGDFGDIPNFEKEHNRYVRDWMSNAALWWANEFKADGLRLDMTKYCDSDFFLKQISCELNAHNPNVFLIAEDGRENQYSVTAYEEYDIDHIQDVEYIDESINNILQKKRGSSPNALGYDSEWDFPLMHELKDSLLETESMNLGRFDNKLRNSQHRVKFLMSHDEIGNMDGTRLISKIMSKELHLYDRVEGFSDGNKGQKAAQISQKISEMYLKGEFENLSQKELEQKLKGLGLKHVHGITKEHIDVAFEIAFAKQKLGLATVMSLPGPKMFFQGDDELNVGHFKFFREFSSDKYARKNPQYIQDEINRKGYDHLESIARPDSIVSRIKLDEDNKHLKRFTRFMKQIQFFAHSPLVTQGEIVNTYIDNHHKVHIHHLRHGKEEALIIKNFGNHFHENSYGFGNFPEGVWKEVHNSDQSAFGGLNYHNLGRKDDITAQNQKLNLAPNSVSILKRVK